MIELDGESSRPVRGTQFAPMALDLHGRMLLTFAQGFHQRFLFSSIPFSPLGLSGNTLCLGQERRPKSHVVHLACSQPQVGSSMYLLYKSYRREKPIEIGHCKFWMLSDLCQKEVNQTPELSFLERMLTLDKV
ncbi:Hypothetical predicted protein [Marmota monax]|uniref:Uncharacterized protein n=1 Tax=Marmota monax TaxID=9995 RepID=A0A5E4CH46_MARMO|nr:hypothetical protein GHT09_010843 [Marmota monax]VTJ80459.1 Hypothetical predicted protein [Marmota monax]